MCATPNVQVHVVEAVYGDREPECAPTVLNYNYKAVYIDSEIWLKENLINIGIRDLLPRDWKYVAWVDCDIHFRNEGWALATIHQLQHYNIVQPWTHAVDLDFHGGIIQTATSFGYLCASRKKMHHGNHPNSNHYTYAHSGYAWACTRYFYENVGGLIDFAIVGSADHHQAWSCLGKIHETIHHKAGRDYVELCIEWGRRAKRACAGIVGFVNGTIEHNFHGSKKNRQYWSRWDILISNNYNPKTDLCYDAQGVVQLCSSNKYKIEHDVMLYNRNRAEDGIDF